MVVTGKLATLKEMEPIAKIATHDALKGYRPPASRQHLTLGSELTESQGIFELYIAGERPQDAQVISRATIDRKTREVQVEVFLDPIA
jgi:hypothetical protein